MSETAYHSGVLSRPSSLIKDAISLTYLIVLLAMIPTALGYFNRIWSSGHYQFAILFIPLALAMMKSRLDQMKSPQAGSTLATALLMLITVGLMFFATFVAPHLWILSFLTLITCYVVDRYGWQGLRSVLPLLLLMIVVVPLPRGLDSLLVTKMQFLASNLASWVLDAIGLVHFRSGVILATPTEQFMTEEACSGVRSLFSSLGAVGLYCVYKEYSIWRSLFNLTQTVFWVLFGNAIRIATVVFVAENYTKSIAEGRPHELLGLVIFFMIILLVVSTDRILQVILDMRQQSQNTVPFSEATIDGTVNPVSKSSAKPLPKFLRWSFALFAVVLALCGVRLMTSTVNAHVFNPLFESPAFPISAGPDLPQSIGPWELQEFEAVSRGEDVILANQSYIWTYKNGNVELLVSVDGPWEFWHDISYCYRGVGWNTDVIQKFDLQPAGKQPTSGPLNHTRIELSRNSGEKGVVLFTQNDLDGNEVQPNILGGTISLELIKLNAMQRFRSLMGENFKFDPASRQYKLPLTTIQVFCGNANGLNEAQLAEIEKFYFEVRRLLLASPRFQSK